MKIRNKDKEFKLHRSKVYSNNNNNNNNINMRNGFQSIIFNQLMLIIINRKVVWLFSQIWNFFYSRRILELFKTP
jgi:hypothetical protein